MSKAIADVCVQYQGLQVVQLPSGLPAEHAEVIVREANRHFETRPPFAILVGDEDDTDSDALLPRVPKRKVLQYRRGDRLAVVAGSSVDVASFDRAYRSVVGPGFPAQVTESVTLASLSIPVVDNLVRELGTAVDDVVSNRCADELSLSMSVLARCYELATDTTRGWNGLWFDHVERGLTALAAALHEVDAATGHEPFGHSFERLLWPCMGLPQAAGRKRWQSEKAPREFMDALGEYWSDKQSIDLSLAQLRQVIAEPDWSVLDWDDLERERIGRESLLGALQSVVSRPNGVEVWAEMDRIRFESPVATSEPLLIQDQSGESLTIDGDGSPAIVTADHVDAEYRSTTFSVVIPCRAPLSTEDLEDVQVRTSSTAIAFVPQDFQLADDPSIVVTGYLRCRSKARVAPVQTRLSLALTAGSVASGVVAAKAEATVVLALTSVGALAWPIRQSLGKSVYSGPETREEDQAGGRFTSELTANVQHLVVVWGHGYAGSTSTLTALPASGMASSRIAGGADFEVAVGDSTILFQGASGEAGYVTPLTAAVMKGSVDHSALGEDIQASVRGIMEQHLIAGSEAPLLGVLGHVVAAADQTTTATAFEPVPQLGVAGVPGYPQAWSAQTGHFVPSEVLDSQEAGEFREATRALLHTVKVYERKLWPSRTSWKHLAGSDVLDRYLRAYGALVASSRSSGPMGRFWSCHPFAVSVWQGRKCVAVMLSPLHPIRLAWLASAEATLAEAEAAQRLAGTVEGWQFPVIGPAPTPRGRMVAIPSDAGPEQVFAAWSMMVPVSSDENDQLRSPSRTLGKPAPGTSPSGLTASAAEAALRDFLRANAYVPSLTIDLAAGSDTARLAEVDRAVIATIQSLAQASNRWGVRILDSAHRTGDLPRAELVKLMSDSQGACTLTWSRYRPESPGNHPGTKPRSNLRLLQDSGAEVRTLPASSAAAQVAGRIPLRRFSAGDRLSGGEAFRGARLAPTGWKAFDDALSAVESTPNPSELGIRLAQSYLLDRSADWTVSGEAFLSPAAVSSLVAAPGGYDSSAGERVLWEWRPPYLQGRHGGAVDRRPYVTVARVSPALRNNLARKLREITGWDDDELDQTVTDVLIRLGTYGLGLSSLLTRGGTHESGALGFYLSYELLGLGRDERATDVVLPIDACATFLTALGGNEPRNTTKRADLLLLRFIGDEVFLVPVEIKFYGTESISGYQLPKPGAEFKEALGQLAETVNSLEQVVAASEASEGADRALWYSAFTTLVESGLHLGAGSQWPQAHESVLAGLVGGQTRLRLGRALIMYFAHQPESEDEVHTYTDQALGSQIYGALVARPHTMFRTLASGTGEGELQGRVHTLLEWASLSEERSPESDGGATSSGAPTGHGGTQPFVRDTDPRHKESADTETEANAADLRDQPRVEDEVHQDVGTRPEKLRGDGVRFPVGRFIGSLGQATPEFWPSNTQLNQLNIGVVGDLGTGKTQLLQGLILSLRRFAAENQPNPLSFLVLDYKRDFQKPEFLDAVGGVVLAPHDIPINPFQLGGQYSNLHAYERAKDFCDVLERIYSGIGPVQRQRLTTALLDSYAAHPDVAPLMSEVLGRYQEEVTADSVTSILRDFVMREVFIEDRGPTTSFDDLLEDRVVVLALDQLKNDQDGKNALVALFLNEYYAYMQGRRKWAFEGSDPSLRRLNSYLLVDEAVNIMRYDFEVLENLLLQGREFGVGVMLSSQFLSHFKTARKNWAEPLLTWFVHKVPHVTAKDLERIGLDASPELAAQVGTLPVHEAVYKSLGVPGRRIRGNPFFELIRRETQE